MNMHRGGLALKSDTAAVVASAEPFVGGPGADTLVGGKGDDVLDGGLGADLLVGAAGNDTILWNPGDGNDVVDGGKGEDTLVFNMAAIDEIVSLVADGGHAAVTRNVGTVRMDLDNVERVAFAARGGADLFAIGDLAATEVSHVDVDLGIGDGGDSQSDTVAIDGGASGERLVLTQDGATIRLGGLSADLTLTHAESADHLSVNAAGGDDVLDASGLAGGILTAFNGGEGLDTLAFSGDAASNVIQLLAIPDPASAAGDQVFLTLDGMTSQVNVLNVETLLVGGGVGDDRIDGHLLVSRGANLDGGDGADTLTGGAARDTLDGGRGDDRIDGGAGGDVMRGGAGDDTLVWNPGGGSDTVDGGAGEDRLVFAGSNAAEIVRLTALDGHAILTRSLGGVVMDVDGVEHVTINALNGADSFQVGLLGDTDVQRLDIGLGGFSGGGDDEDDIVSLTVGKGDLDVHITDFELHAFDLVKGDVLALNGFADHSFFEALSAGHIAQSGADVVIADGSGLTVTLEGVSLALLQASDFLFG